MTNADEDFAEMELRPGEGGAGAAVWAMVAVVVGVAALIFWILT